MIGIHSLGAVNVRPRVVLVVTILLLYQTSPLIVQLIVDTSVSRIAKAINASHDHVVSYEYFL